MKRIRCIVVLISVFVFFSLSCGKEGAAGAASSDPVRGYEEMIAKASKTLPSFASPIMEDPELKVEGVPEDVTWLYAIYPDLGSPDVKKGGVWHDWITEYPTTFRDIGPESNVGTRSLMANNLPLVGINGETREFFSVAASHWAFSADERTVYFKLREDINWSDGEPCTADDYVFDYDAKRSPDSDDYFWPDHYTRWEVKKISKYCIAIKNLEDGVKPKSILLLYANMSPRPKHFYPNGITKGWYKEYNYKYQPTTGPYYMAEDENIKGEMLVFKKVKDWWGHKIYGNGIANFDTIEYKVITGGNDIAKEYFYKGELELIKSLTIPQEWKDAAGNDKVVNGYVDRWIFNYVPLQGLTGLFFNVKVPFLSDVKVRQALYYAFDMQGMIDTALFGEYRRMHNIGIGQEWGGYSFNDTSIKKPDFDPKKAGELLAEAGYDKIGSDGIRVNASGTRAAFEILYSAPHHTERLTVLKEQAKKAGVELNLKMMQQGMFNAVLSKKHQSWWGGMTTYYYPSYWQMFSKENAEKPQTNNFFAYTSPEMEQLIEKERTLKEIKDLAENNKEIERLVDKEALVIPGTYNDYVRIGLWKWVRFPAWGNMKYDDTPYEPMFSYAWIDPEIKKEVESAAAAGKTFEPKVWRLSSRYIDD